MEEMRDYRVAKETEYLVITGTGIPELKLAKRARILPGQTCSILDISRINYHFELQAMTSDNQAFLLPMVSKIGPRVDDIDCLWRFAKLASSHHPHYDYVFHLIQGIIEKELRVLSTSITMDEMLKGINEYSDEFNHLMEKFFENVEMKLDQFGLHTYGATIDKLVQVPAQEYYSYLGRCERIQNKKANQNQNAEFERGVGGVFLNAIVTIDNDFKVQEVNAEVCRKQKLADAMLYEKEKAAEAQRIAAEADLFAKQKEEEGELFATQKKAEGELFVTQKKEEGELFATQKKAEGELFVIQKKAEGELFAKKMEVEGSIVLAEAQDAYLMTLLDAFGGNNIAVRDYLMMKNEVYQDMAKINVGLGAVAGLKPDISVWTNGRQSLEGSGEGSNPAMKEITGVY